MNMMIKRKTKSEYTSLSAAKTYGGQYRAVEVTV